MKPASQYALSALFIFLTSTIGIGTHAQDKGSMKNMIDSKNFVFKAQSVSASLGSMRQLTPGDYDLRVLGDSVVSYLPYFGRAYAPVDINSEGGIKFTSTEFTYQVEKKKKRWSVTILPKDTRDVRQIFLTIAENGNADLNIVSINRQPISFHGYVEDKKAQ